MQPVKDVGSPKRRGRPSRGVRAAVLAATRSLISKEGLAGATSNAIAERAGASEASIHYHFGGKEALLETAILEALEPLHEYQDPPGSDDDSLPTHLLKLATALERAYEELVPLLAAVQSDPQLRRAVGPRLSAHDLGPHRAVASIARYLASKHDHSGSGTRIDAEAAALLIVGACFIRAWQHQMSTHRRHPLPSLARAITVLLEQGPKP